MQGILCRSRLLIALLFLVLEATSFALDQIGGNQFDVLVASLLLSLMGFLMTAFAAAGSRTDVEKDRNMIELAFSVVQLMMTFVYLSLSILSVKINSNIASIFPLVLGVTSLALACKHNELAQTDIQPSTPEGDEEWGFPSDNPPGIDVEEETTPPSINGEEEEIPESRAPPQTDIQPSTPGGDEEWGFPSDNPPGINVEEETTPPSINGEEEEIPESRAPPISSDTPTMSGNDEITDSEAPAKPAVS
ncbi:hypothetical protein ACOSQ4_003983 [Xanthoceras sorbifolium]